MRNATSHLDLAAGHLDSELNSTKAVLRDRHSSFFAFGDL